MHSTRVVAVLTLVVGLAHCFPWDIVVGGDKQLYFYYNGTLTHTAEIPFVTQITSVTYDPVHYRVLFADVDYPNLLISCFDLTTRKVQTLLAIKTDNSFVRVAYDPVTQLLVWTEAFYLHTVPLNGPYNQTADGTLLFKLNHYCRDLAVDSCGGYIYWITRYEIERARLDGSEREVLINEAATVRFSLAIDQQTQRIYWIDFKYLDDGFRIFIESANFYGKNKTTLYTAKKTSYASSLAVSKDYIYWQNSGEVGTWQLPKNSSEHVARKLHTTVRLSSLAYQRVATNYTIQEQIQGIKSCEALQGLIPNNSKPESTVSICRYYCLEGDCGVNAEGQPVCSCKAGYSGKRCEVNACHQYCLHNGVCSLNEEDEPTCECTADYVGERCEVPIRKDNSVSAEEVTTFRSGVSNTGERKIDACHQYCLHNGVCSLNELDEPACRCTADYEGERCEVSVNKDFYCQAACSVSAEGQPTVTVNVGDGVQSTCASTVV